MKRRDFTEPWRQWWASGSSGSQSVAGDGAGERAATADVAQIYQLQAAFHRAKTAQDIELMMSLWDTNARLKLQGDLKSPYVGMEQLRGYWLNSGSFKTRRFSLVPCSRHASRSATTSFPVFRVS